MAIAIGDIHGCLGPLERLVEQLPPGEELVFLGDYVDRGPDSAGVVRFLEALAERRRCTFLMGNHEEMMALAQVSDDALPQWLINGGEQTLLSYGVDPGAWAMQPPPERSLPEFDRFYRRLKLYHEDADAIYVHAGIDLRVGNLEAQERRVLLWVREPFLRGAASWEGKPIVFGHTPTNTLGRPLGTPFLKHRYRGIDTACVYGGALTAMDMHTGQLWQAANPQSQPLHSA